MKTYTIQQSSIAALISVNEWDYVYMNDNHDIIATPMTDRTMPFYKLPRKVAIAVRDQFMSIFKEPLENRQDSVDFYRRTPLKIVVDDKDIL